MKKISVRGTDKVPRGFCERYAGIVAVESGGFGCVKLTHLWPEEIKNWDGSGRESAILSEAVQSIVCMAFFLSLKMRGGHSSAVLGLAGGREIRIGSPEPRSSILHAPVAPSFSGSSYGGILSVEGGLGKQGLRLA